MKLYLAVISCLLLSSISLAAELSTAEHLTREVPTLKGMGGEFLAGLYNGISLQASADFYALPSCINEVPIRIESVKLFWKFIISMEKFDLDEIFDKFCELILQDGIPWVRACLTPYVYYKHFEPLFKGLTWENAETFLIRGLMYNSILVVPLSFAAISECMNDGYYYCGEYIGRIAWLALVR